MMQSRRLSELSSASSPAANVSNHNSAKIVRREIDGWGDREMKPVTAIVVYVLVGLPALFLGTHGRTAE